MRLKIVPVTDKEKALMVQQMHQGDRDSTQAIFGTSIEEAMDKTLARAAESYAAYCGDDLLCIFGVTKNSLLCEWVCFWMVGTDNINKHPVAFARCSREVTARVIDKYKWTKNYVDARNTTSIRWLKWLGFTIHPAVPFGYEGRLFHMNELRKQ
jgi:hypothetical protein